MHLGSRRDKQLQSLILLPPPLTTTVLRTFRKWYHTRAPLRMTQQEAAGTGWSVFESMLEETHKEHFRPLLTTSAKQETDIEQQTLQIPKVGSLRTGGASGPLLTPTPPRNVRPKGPASARRRLNQP